jgi:hypothetical protein
MKGLGRYPNGKQIWRCSKCGTVSPWTPTWRWYGSWVNKKTKQEPDVQRVYCSEACSGRVSFLDEASP